MAVKLGVCYCLAGVMSQCVAGSKAEQFYCDFYDKSRAADRCMHLNPDMDNHCWSSEAQNFSNQHGVVRHTGGTTIPSSTPRYIAPEAAVPTTAHVNSKSPTVGSTRQTCLDCVNDPGCPLQANTAGNMGKSLTSLTDQDYWNIASGCPSYILFVKI